MKQHGVSEENVQEALRIQNSLPTENRPLTGQVSLDAQLATKPQVDNAFEQQKLKGTLSGVHKEVFGPAHRCQAQVARFSTDGAKRG